MGQADTSMTKVFVGGLAWETEKESLREHFDKFGEILEAVIIFDKATGRSKGYGFVSPDSPPSFIILVAVVIINIFFSLWELQVTFREAEAAKKACEEATPTINGRRANCNLASLGARRIKATISQSQIGN